MSRLPWIVSCVLSIIAESVQKDRQNDLARSFRYVRIHSGFSAASLSLFTPIFTPTPL